MKRLIRCGLVFALITMVFPSVCMARGTRYVINWPLAHIGPVYVQVFDIQCNPPYELPDRFKVWVNWDDQTACYDIGNRGTYLLKFYKNSFAKGPMIISGNSAGFRIRYSLVAPWI